MGCERKKESETEMQTKRERKERENQSKKKGKRISGGKRDRKDILGKKGEHEKQNEKQAERVTRRERRSHVRGNYGFVFCILSCVCSLYCVVGVVYARYIVWSVWCEGEFETIVWWPVCCHMRTISHTYMYTAGIM